MMPETAGVPSFGMRGELLERERVGEIVGGAFFRRLQLLRARAQRSGRDVGALALELEDRGHDVVRELRAAHRLQGPTRHVATTGYGRSTTGWSSSPRPPLKLPPTAKEAQLLSYLPSDSVRGRRPTSHFGPTPNVRALHRLAEAGEHSER